MAAAFSVVGAVVGEFVGAQAGLGVLILQMEAQADTGGSFAVCVVLSVIGIVLTGTAAPRTAPGAALDARRHLAADRQRLRLSKETTMSTRRDFSLGLGALGLAALLPPALAQNLRVMKVANTAAVNDPQQCFVTAGQHPKLNFYKPAGVDVEYVNMSSMVQAMQSLRSGHVDFGPAVPGILLPAMAKDPTLDLVSIYKWLPRNANVIVVKPAARSSRRPTWPASASACATRATRHRDHQDHAGGAGDQGRQERIHRDRRRRAGGRRHRQRPRRCDGDLRHRGARIELVGTKLRYVPLTPKFAQVGSAGSACRASC
jgi:hypothetical protein